MAKRSAKCPQCGNRVEVDSETGGKIVCLECKATLTVNIRKTGEPDHTKKPAEPVDPLIGTSLREFEIMGLLGRGGMGAVYRAKDAKLDRQVAVKVLAPQYARDPKFVQRFEREARAAAAVNHTNIIQIHSVGADRGHQYIAMELVEGETLGDVLRHDGPVSPDRAVEIMKQVAAALAEAHGAGIVHRDIKPSNILLTPRGGVKVADFGLAKRPDVDVAVTQAGKILGTPLYMPPEVASGEEFEPRSDLYSLGATFYHALAGRPPFQGSTGAEIAVKQVKDEVPPLAEVAPDVPAVLARLIHRLLSKAPADRPATAAAVLEALKYIDADMAAAKSPSGLGTALPPAQRRVLRKIPTAKKAERPKLLIPGVIAAAVLAIGIGFVLIFALGGDEHQPKKGEPPSVAKPVVVKPKPKPPKEPPAWQAAWQAAKAKADGLAKDEKFGPALAVYEALGAEHDDAELSRKIQQSASALHDQAAAAWRRVRDEAQSLSDRKKFDEATAALRPALAVFGVTEHTQQARTMLAKIAAARTAAKPTPPHPATQPVVVKPTPKTQPAPATQPKPTPADDLRRRRETQYARALRPIEALVAAWAFRGAEAALVKVKFKDKELTQRLATRRDELQRLAKLKAKMIEQIKKAKPWLQKRSVAVRGPGGVEIRTVGSRVVDADDGGLTVQVTDKDQDKTEVRKWQSLSGGNVQQFLKLAVDGKSADDHLAVGILALARNDHAAAEKHFEKARSLGAKIDPYLAPLAAAAFAKAKALLAAGKYTDADKALAALEQKYAKTPWFAAHKDELDSARARAGSAIAHADAEKLYAQAVKLFDKKALWDLKLIVEKLKSDYPKTTPVTDTKRTPSFAEMAKAVEKLPQPLTVRQDGKGDHKTIQAAIDAAPPDGLVEIQDSEPYNEKIVIPKEKKGLTLRGRRGCWPTITSKGPGRDIDILLAVKAPETTLERLVLAHPAPAGTPHRCLSVEATSCQLRSVIIAMQGSSEGFFVSIRCAATVTDSFIASNGAVSAGSLAIVNSTWVAKRIWWIRTGLPLRPLKVLNSVLITDAVDVGPMCSVRDCTIRGGLSSGSRGEGSVVFGSIVGTVSGRESTQIEYCNVFGRPPFTGKAKPGKGCFSGNPQFRDPKNFDYRLKKTSPCCGKAADGGDVGCRYTPEMIEMLKKALELRRKGIIKF